MAITIQYAPAASQYGTAGFLAGRGSYETDQRKRQQDLELALAEMQQRERMQGASIAASRQNTLDSLAANRIGQLTSIAANQQQQAFDLVGSERRRLFDFYAGQADRQQTAQLNSALAQQKAIQDAQAGQLDWQNRQDFELFQSQLEAQQERQKQAARLDFARRQQEEKHAVIDAEAQRRIDAIRQSPILRDQDKQRAIAQVMDEAGANKAGGDWTVGSLGPSPQEQLQNAWNDKVLMVGQTPVQLNDDGTFEAVRGWQLPEEKAEQEQEAARVKLDFEKQKMAADLKMKAADYALKLMNEKVQQPTGVKDANGQPVMQDMPRFSSFEEAYGEASKILGLGQALAGDIHQGGFTPANQPTMEQLTGGGQQQQAAPPQPSAEQPIGQPQASVPEQNQAVPQAGQRPRVASYSDLQKLGQAPPDLTPTELGFVGTSVVTPEQIPEQLREPVHQLHSLSARLPEGDKSAWSERSLRIFEGAMLAYGPDPSQWPVQVRQQIVAEAAEVQRLLRAQRDGSRSR